MKKIIKKSSFFVLTLLVTTGCSSISQPDLNLVKEYQKPIETKPNEKLVYVIRESNVVGAARGAWIAHNKHTVADLGSGDYTYFTVPVGVNTINVSQNISGVGYFAIDEKNNDTVFLKYLYTEGKMVKLPKDLGITYVMKYNKVSPLKNVRKNDGYELGVMNLAKFDNLKIMSKASNLMHPTDKTSIITFFTEDNYSPYSSATIWHNNTIAGNLNGKNYFQIRVPKGKHYFYVKSQVYYALEANIEGGKNYAVKVTSSLGWTAPHVTLNPIDLRGKRLSSLISNLNHEKLDVPLADNIVKRIENAQPILNKVKNEIVSGSKKPKILDNSFGI